MSYNTENIFEGIKYAYIYKIHTSEYTHILHKYAYVKL